MINFKLLSILLIVYALFSSCSGKEETTTINGNIPNLPNGTLYIYKDNSINVIDSVKTKFGKFSLLINWMKKDEPAYIGIDHIDQNGILRAFSFPTNAKYRNGDWDSQFFFSDKLIVIDGEIKNFDTKNVKLSEKYKIVTTSKIVAGKQTQAFYNIDGDLFEKIDDKTIQIIREKLKKYPYSYHLLYKISENKNSFSPQQIQEFLKFFKGEITQSESYKKLYTYNQKRFNEKNIAVPLLEDDNGVKREILDKNYKKHLIIFWASWCGPCRQEIPLLKEMYKKYGSEVEFISISTDEDENAWQKAMDIEKMEWKQLIATTGSPEHEKLQIHFKLNSAIPYTVLVDNDLKILSSSMGLSNKAELEKLIDK